VCDLSLSFRELLEIYGLDLNEITRLQMEIQLPQTHLISPDVHDLNRRIAFPEKINPNLMWARHICCHEWSRLGGDSACLPSTSWIKKRLYGYIGMKDFTLHPFILPVPSFRLTTVTQEFSHAGGRPTLIGPSTFSNFAKDSRAGGARWMEGTSASFPFLPPG